MSPQAANAPRRHSTRGRCSEPAPRPTAHNEAPEAVLLGSEEQVSRRTPAPSRPRSTSSIPLLTCATPTALHRAQIDSLCSKVPSAPALTSRGASLSPRQRRSSSTPRRARWPARPHTSSYNVQGMGWVPGLAHPRAERARGLVLPQGARGPRRRRGRRRHRLRPAARARAERRGARNPSGPRASRPRSPRW